MFPAATPAAAFDLAGLFGSDKPPAVSATTLPYALTFKVEGLDKDDDSDVEQVLRDASGTYKLRKEAPPDGDGLMRRLQADSGPMLDALWALGYYNARIAIRIAGQPVQATEAGLDAGAAKADAFRNRVAVPVELVATLGPLFRLRRVHVDYPIADAPDGLPRMAFRLKPGDPARSARIRAAQVRLVDWFRARSHPLTKIADVKAVVDHSAAVMDLDLVVAPGPAAGIGAVTVSGTKDVPPAVVGSRAHRGKRF